MIFFSFKRTPFHLVVGWLVLSHSSRPSEAKDLFPFRILEGVSAPTNDSLALNNHPEVPLGTCQALNTSVQIDPFQKVKPLPSSDLNPSETIRWENHQLKIISTPSSTDLTDLTPTLFPLLDRCKVKDKINPPSFLEKKKPGEINDRSPTNDKKNTSQEVLCDNKHQNIAVYYPSTDLLRTAPVSVIVDNITLVYCLSGAQGFILAPYFPLEPSPQDFPWWIIPIGLGALLVIAGGAFIACQSGKNTNQPQREPLKVSFLKSIKEDSSPSNPSDADSDQLVIN